MQHFSITRSLLALSLNFTYPYITQYLNKQIHNRKCRHATRIINISIANTDLDRDCALAQRCAPLPRLPPPPPFPFLFAKSAIVNFNFKYAKIIHASEMRNGLNYQLRNWLHYLYNMEVSVLRLWLSTIHIELIYLYRLKWF